MKPIFLILLMLASATASAEVYKQIGPDGKVYFSDQPGPDARPVEVAPPQTIHLPPASRQVESGTAQETGPVYTAFSIISPSAEQEVRANDGNVTVQLSLRPELQPAHSVTLRVDGQDGEVIKPGAEMSIVLSNLSRGRHSVDAVVADDAGKVLMQADAVSFIVLRAALGGR